jgi:hypothetical protein
VPDRCQLLPQRPREVLEISNLVKMAKENGENTKPIWPPMSTSVESTNSRGTWGLASAQTEDSAENLDGPCIAASVEPVVSRYLKLPDPGIWTKADTVKSADERHSAVVVAKANMFCTQGFFEEKCPDRVHQIESAVASSSICTKHVHNAHTLTRQNRQTTPAESAGRSADIVIPTGELLGARVESADPKLTDNELSDRRGVNQCLTGEASTSACQERQHVPDRRGVNQCLSGEASTSACQERRQSQQTNTAKGNSDTTYDKQHHATDKPLACQSSYPMAVQNSDPLIIDQPVPDRRGVNQCLTGEASTSACQERHPVPDKRGVNQCLSGEASTSACQERSLSRSPKQNIDSG